MPSDHVAFYINIKKTAYLMVNIKKKMFSMIKQLNKQIFPELIKISY